MIRLTGNHPAGTGLRLRIPDCGLEDKAGGAGAKGIGMIKGQADHV
jgi:hypothetical protein